MYFDLNADIFYRAQTFKTFRRLRRRIDLHRKLRYEQHNDQLHLDTKTKMISDSKK